MFIFVFANDFNFGFNGFYFFFKMKFFIIEGIFVFRKFYKFIDGDYNFYS